MKTATITFHSAHNYGSMLQAYALQQTIQSLGAENEIINLRTDRQKEFYPRPVLSAKNLIVGGIVRGMQRKYDLFESFMSDYLDLTEEFHNPDELDSLADKYDLFIAGSDQIWNPECYDFTFAYYLPFASDRISYATSFGPHGREVQAESERIRSELLKYRAVSVREQGSADIVKSLTGRDPEILPDPVVLLDRNCWDELAGAEPARRGDYIFTYHPFPRHKFTGLSRRIGKKLKMKNVSSIVRPTLSGAFKNSGFKKNPACGPIEFLNLIRHSSLIISGSFHAVLFAILFEKPFYAVCEEADNRIGHLLRVTGLEDRFIGIDDYKSKIAHWQDIDFSEARKTIGEMRQKGIEYLTKHCTI